MNKVLKYSLIGAGALVGLVVLAMVLVLLLVDPNDYKDDIAAAVREQTGRTLSFQGDLSLSLFPWIGLETGGLSLSNAPGFGEKPFAAIGSSEIKVKLVPLFSRQVEVGKIVLENLDLNLVKNEQGKTNWEDLAQAGAAEKTKGGRPEQPGEEGVKPLALAVGGVDIKDARISWSDRQAGKSYVIEDLDLSTGSIVPNEPFDLRLHVKMTSNEPALDLELDLSGEIVAQLEKRIYQVKGMKLELDAQGEALKGGKAGIELAADVTADEINKVYTVESMKLTADAEGGAVPGGKAEAELTGQVKADLQAQTATVTDLVLTAYGLRVSGGVQAAHVLEAPAARINLRVDPFDAQKLMQSLGREPIETSDPQALRKVALQTVVEYAPADLQAKDLILTLDETTAKGNVRIQNFNATTPYYQAALQVDAINVDRYTPPPAKDEKKTPAPEEKKPGQQEQAGLPMETLRKLHCDAEMDVGRLVVNNLKFSDVHVEVHAKDGVVRVKPFKLTGYGSALASGLALDARSDTPAADLDLSLAGLKLAPFLTDLVGKPEAEGVVDLTADLSTKGQAKKELLRHLNGKASFKMKDGSVSNFNPVLILKNAVSVLRGGSKDQSAAKTYSDLAGSVNIKNGVVYNRDLDVKSPMFRAKGAGLVDLADEKIKYVMDTSLVASAKGQGGADVSDLIGVTIPIGISGSLTDPSIGVDMEKMAGIILKTGVRNVEGLLKGTGDGLGKGLETLRDTLTGGSKDSGAKDSGRKEEEQKKEFKPQDLIKGLF